MDAADAQESEAHRGMNVRPRRAGRRLGLSASATVADGT